MKSFDCRLGAALPELEIEAETIEDAKQLYLAAVLRALSVELVEAIEVEIVE